MAKLTVYLEAETSVEFEEVELDEEGNVINLEDYIRVAKDGASPEWQAVAEWQVDDQQT